MDLATPRSVGDRYVPQIIPNVTFDELYFSSTKKVNVSLVQRGSWSKSSLMEYMPVDLKEYTYLYPQQYFLIFFCILLLHIFTVIFVKFFTSKLFKTLSLPEKFFHALECINFAFPYHDWDQENGDGQQHYTRMLETKREVQINLLVNTIFNLMLLFPLPLLCKYTTFILFG